MAQINKPTDYFNTVLYTGDGTNSRAVTGVGFQPDFSWLKNRTGATAYHHQTFDSVRGASAGALYTSLDNAEDTVYPISSFDSDGITLRATSHDSQNASGYTFASWHWLASNSTASNTDGDIASSVSANTTSGFSIVSYTGNGTGGATVGHGLGVAPKAVIVKARTTGNTQNWFVNYPFGTGDGYIMLNKTNAGSGADNTVWNSTAPNASTVTLGTTSGVNDASYNYIMYCFAEKKGFSKFGSYTGNGNADGTFVYTGFKPAFVMTKCSSTSSTYTNWGMFDSKRPGYNQIDKVLGADLSDSENGSTIGTQYMDFLSNGFKCRNNGSPHNISGATYIYMAFASEPLVGSNNVCATAR